MMARCCRRQNESRALSLKEEIIIDASSPTCWLLAYSTKAVQASVFLKAFLWTGCKRKLRANPRFLYLSAVDILGGIFVFVGSYPIHHNRFSSQIPITPLCRNNQKMFPDIAKGPLGAKIACGWETWLTQHQGSMFKLIKLHKCCVCIVVSPCGILRDFHRWPVTCQLGRICF